jgi:hypothetical protein
MWPQRHGDLRVSELRSERSATCGFGCTSGSSWRQRCRPVTAPPGTGREARCNTRRPTSKRIRTSPARTGHSPGRTSSKAAPSMQRTGISRSSRPGASTVNGNATRTVARTPTSTRVAWSSGRSTKATSTPWTSTRRPGSTPPTSVPGPMARSRRASSCRTAKVLGPRSGCLAPISMRMAAIRPGRSPERSTFSNSTGRKTTPPLKPTSITPAHRARTRTWGPCATSFRRAGSPMRSTSSSWSGTRKPSPGSSTASASRQYRLRARSSRNFTRRSSSC